MRSRLYASSFVGHSLYSNFHATASLRTIKHLLRHSSREQKLNQDLSVNLLGTFLCSRSARLEYPRNDPLQKEFVLSFRANRHVAVVRGTGTGNRIDWNQESRAAISLVVSRSKCQKF